MKKGTIPEMWRHATLKVLYKGKGDAGNPNSYRGIALECTAFKILTSLLTKRLQNITRWAIPEQQFEFVKDVYRWILRKNYGTRQGNYTQYS